MLVFITAGGMYLGITFFNLYVSNVVEQTSHAPSKDFVTDEVLYKTQYIMCYLKLLRTKGKTGY
jgi:hypothetical protein